jgi:hypothetical protein
VSRFCVQIYAVSITIRIVVSCFAYHTHNTTWCMLCHSWNHLLFMLSSVQLGFLLLECFWKFDFPPILVLVIAILNDGNKTDE